MTVNIPAINIAVIACANPIGLTNDKAQEDIAIPKDIAGSIRTK